MPNLTEMPTSFAAGETLSYTKLLSDYPASAGWALTVYLAGKKPIHAHATASGDSFVVVFSATDTTALLPGLYYWTERVDKAGEVHDAATGTVDVKPNLATATDGSIQSINEKLLDLIDARLAGRLLSDVERYSVAGRTVERIPAEKLLAERTRISNLLEMEKNPTRISRSILFSFPGTGFEQ